MNGTLNYLLCRHGEDTSAKKDGYIKFATMGIGLGVGASAIAYAKSYVESSITAENALYCTARTLAALHEIQKQIQVFNASCSIEDPGSNMSVCNRALLPKPVNVTCSDMTQVGFVSYLPVMTVIAGVVALGLLMGRSIVTSYHQAGEQSEGWYVYRNERMHLLPSEAETFSELLTDYTEKESSEASDIEVGH